MKQYVKTPLKYTLPLLCIGALVLVSISGCTSPATTSPSPSSSSGPTATPSVTPTPNPNAVTPFTSDQLNTLTNSEAGLGMQVQTPYYLYNFSSNGDPTYYAVFTNATVTKYVGLFQTHNATEAIESTNLTVANFQKTGWSGNSTATTDGTQWIGTIPRLSTFDIWSWNNTSGVPATTYLYAGTVNFSAQNRNVAVAIVVVGK
jgi:hypothetical protein